MVTTDTSGDKNSNKERPKSENMTPERRKKSQPAGTIEYTVRKIFFFFLNFGKAFDYSVCTVENG